MKQVQHNVKHHGHEYGTNIRARVTFKFAGVNYIN